ncbi:MAG: patatin-like phospholipase family protein [Gammaproteobacteria bacterium]|nr:patatin-like phospholipase family protein [Gammaproteobacteria bacterium]
MSIPPIAALQPNRKALILPGGGMRVAYQAGAIQALYRAGLRFSYADATSGGIFNLSALMSGLSVEELAVRWRNLRPMDFVSFQSLSAYLRPSKLMAIGDFAGIERRVFPHLGIKIDNIRSASNLDATFNVCKFDDKIVHAIPSKDIAIPLLLAGISLPWVTPPVLYDGCYWTDAVWIKDSNILDVVKKGANEIWIIWCIGNTEDYLPGWLNQYVHMIEMSAVGALNAELARIQEFNNLIKKGRKPYGHDQPITVHAIRPRYPIPLDWDYLRGKVSGDALVDQGYADASSYLETHDAKGISPAISISKMTAPSIGVSFREKMKGFIFYREMDSRFSTNSEVAIPIILNATINIRDLQQFCEHSDHRGEMVAHLECPRLGGLLPATKTDFQLFSPTHDANVVEMVYESGFWHEGQHYFFSGRKSLTKSTPFRLWRDTTTLFVNLHKGNDRSDPVIATGVLKLSFVGLLSLLATLHCRDARGIRLRVSALLKFGLFFISNLWMQYGIRMWRRT